MFEKIKDRGFQVLTLNHAEAILLHDMPEAVDEIESALLEIAIPVAELVRSGGGEAALTQRLRRRLTGMGWKKHKFEIKKVIDEDLKESISHEIDHIKTVGSNCLALEIEWNNKDPFYDRDLESFKRLHAEGAISVGCIITRGESLQNSLRDYLEKWARQNGVDSFGALGLYYTPTNRQRTKIKRAIARTTLPTASFEKIWAHTFVSDKFGQATTHWRKLVERVDRRVGNPCPLLLIGIPDAIIEL